MTGCEKRKPLENGPFVESVPRISIELHTCLNVSICSLVCCLAVTYSDDFHDRFLIIDNVELHGFGSSINCLGRRVTSYTTRDAKEIAKLLEIVP